ncbi:MAG: T9SS type A sorting domain-containing protein [Saprospiraceae bacterium]|uniref:T9SS type A sorting domain-containing protein n=1 Tax=Candidatus Opimibacter skivensis TaxID=2982028 RepID=A0A9D7SRS8_9BACT|nr:T9SS type A sorting domain-containing protein [Candidatus Opimibacter skivensis]
MRTLIYIFSILLLLPVKSSFCQSGQPDPTFGIDGIVTTDINSGSTDFLRAIAIQPDQKILAAGSTGSGATSDFLVVRYLPDGSPDPDFGIDGIVRIDFNGVSSSCYAIALQSDGRIVLAGQTSINNASDFAVAQLNTDGSPDTTFSHDGKVITDLTTMYEFANTVLIQKDGKIIAAGRLESKTYSDFAAVRYLANGDLDPDFGVQGIVTTSIRDEDEARCGVIQSDGKIILAGFSSVSAKGDFTMVRYLEDGSIDKSFGTSGKVLTDLQGTGGSDFASSIVEDPNGDLVLTGSANFNNLFLESDIGVARYDADGHLDLNFGNQGIYILQLGGNTQAYGLARQSDGKYIIAGKSDYIFSHNQWLLARINHDGGLDSLFGDHGLTLTDLAGNSEQPFGVLVQNDSRIVAGGLDGDFPALDFVLARYIADYTMTYFIESENLCYGEANASISVTVTSGGVPPLQYSIDGNNFQSGSFFDGLAAGTYTVTVRDSEVPAVTGTIGPITVADGPVPPAVDYEVIDNNITIMIQDPGTFLVSIDGSNFQPVFEYHSLPDGTYHIVVIDLNGCIISMQDVTINFTSVHQPDRFPISLSPNPAKDILSIRPGEKLASVNASITDLSGRLFSREILNTGSDGSLSIDVKALTNGMYILTLNDGNHQGTTKFIVSR